MNRNKLYLFLLIACFIGFAWAYFNYKHSKLVSQTSVCLFKNITHIPCPSCGSSRSVVLLIQGKMFEAIMINPFGVIILLIICIVPLWIIIDLFLKKQSLLDVYKKTEQIIKKPLIAIFLIILVLSNWIWNIYKDL